MLDRVHVVDDSEPKPAALNMAMDEALLEETTFPLLRFYRWRQPSISFGYFGRYAEAAAESDHREIVRRWTGGGIVSHGDDLTYSVMIPASHSFFEKTSREIYSVLHAAICGALARNGITAVLAEDAAPRISGQCFANAVRADVLSHGRKIAGAAHRRSRAGLLHQGSIQCRDLPDRFRWDLARIVCDRFEPKTVSPETRGRAAMIADEKYGTTAWLMRR
jgi:lipoyl(octanoyl) transferase